MNVTIEKYLKHIAQLSKPVQPRFSPGEVQSAWCAMGKYLNPEYEFDHVSKEMFPRLLGQSKKGVCFCGSKGIGKTLNLDIFARINSDLYKCPTEVWETTEIEIQYKATGARILEHMGKLPALVINDAGIESKNLMDYGTGRNVIADLLFLRYRAFQVSGFKTYVSTNMKWESILAHYGSRLADRMNEMFIPMELKGETRRK